MKPGRKPSGRPCAAGCGLPRIVGQHDGLCQSCLDSRLARGAARRAAGEFKRMHNISKHTGLPKATRGHDLRGLFSWVRPAL